MDECYRILKVVMTNQQQGLNYNQSIREVDDIHDMACSHFREHILPAIATNQKKTTNTSQRIFVPTVLTTVPSQVKLEDSNIIENLRKENSELKSKVHLKLIGFLTNRLLM